mmetsp:Transcript_66896/g.118739  ORF Transcript_66896/g.118739 Transcript_66896/m.118739 type:complete len:223 (+) Transcript_66896:157-825(+)
MPVAAGISVAPVTEVQLGQGVFVKEVGETKERNDIHGLHHIHLPLDRHPLEEDNVHWGPHDCSGLPGVQEIVLELGLDVGPVLTIKEHISGEPAGDEDGVIQDEVNQGLQEDSPPIVLRRLPQDEDDLDVGSNPSHEAGAHHVPECTGPIVLLLLIHHLQTRRNGRRILEIVLITSFGFSNGLLLDLHLKALANAITKSSDQPRVQYRQCEIDWSREGHGST